MADMTPADIAAIGGEGCELMQDAWELKDIEYKLLK